MKEFSYKTRTHIIKNLQAGVDVLVVGGGITGAGVINILSSLNIKCGLVDAYDFAHGTSSRSSKLIHGGLRYLAHGQFSMVHNSLKERDFLLQHTGIVKKTRFMIPVDKYSWSKLSLTIGLWIYSLFSRSIKAQWYTREEIVQQEPVLKNIDFNGAFVYQEGITDDSRLVLNLLLSAYNNGAWILNYAELVQVVTENNQVKNVIIRDKLTNSEFVVSTKLLIIATGPWIKKTLTILEPYLPFKKLGYRVKLSKGVHITVKKSVCPLTTAIALRSPIDKRQIFIMPRGQILLIGTTETYFDGDPGKPDISVNDVNYLISSVKHYVPALTKEHIITVFAGVRPLFGKNTDLGKISREYTVRSNKNVIAIFGGKLTTFRIISKKVAKLVIRRLSINHINKKVDVCFTYTKDVESKKLKIIELLKSYNVEITNNTIMFAYDILYEGAMHMDDILWRREGYAIFHSDQGLEFIDECSTVMNKLLNYNTSTINMEIQQYINALTSIEYL